MICVETVTQKIDLAELLKEVLQGPVKVSKSCSSSITNLFLIVPIVITQCCIHELYLQGNLMQPVVDTAKTYERRKCNHKEAIAGDECILSVVGVLIFPGFRYLISYLF